MRSGWPLPWLSEADWDLTLRVNLTGTCPVCQAAGRTMLERCRGRIVKPASKAGSVALPEHLAYSASKFAVIGLTEVLAFEWPGRGVTVNSVSPTVVLTPLGPTRSAEHGELSGEDLRAVLRRRHRPVESLPVTRPAETPSSTPRLRA